MEQSGSYPIRHRRGSEASSTKAESEISRCTWEREAIATVAARLETEKAANPNPWDAFGRSFSYWVRNPYLTGPIEEWPPEKEYLNEGQYDPAWDPWAHPWAAEEPEEKPKPKPYVPNDWEHHWEMTNAVIQYGLAREQELKDSSADQSLPLPRPISVNANPAYSLRSTTISTQGPSLSFDTTLPIRSTYSAVPSGFELMPFLNAYSCDLETQRKKGDTDLANPEQTLPSDSSLVRSMSPTNIMKRSHQTFTGLPAAIFIHAGAGFHSVQNEKYHLGVCSEYVGSYRNRPVLFAHIFCLVPLRRP